MSTLNLVLNGHKLVLNQALCLINNNNTFIILIPTTQACVVLTQDHVFHITKHKLENPMLNRHMFVLNQALCLINNNNTFIILILTTQICVVLTQDRVFRNTKHKLVLQEPQV